MLDALDAPVRVARTGAVVVRLRRRLRRAHEVSWVRVRARARARARARVRLG